MEPAARLETTVNTPPRAITRRPIQLGSYAYEQRRLSLLAGLAQGRAVLDLGYAAMPNKYFKDVQLVGVDLNQPLEPAPQYSEQIVGNVMELPKLFTGRRFDTVVAGELIEHLENPYQFLRDVHSIVASGGRVLLSTPNPLGFPVFLFELLQSRRFYYDREHTYYYLPRWMVRIAESCGFAVEKLVPVGLYTPLGVIPWTPTVFSYQVIYVLKKA